MSDPAAVDPEEALVASASSCHMLWFLSLAREAGLEVASYADRATGATGRDSDGRIAITRIILRPNHFRREVAGAGRDRRAPPPGARKCFIANSLRSEIVIE